MRVAFLGTPEFAVPTLERLVERGHDVVAVFTQPDRPRGRGQQLAWSPVKEAAVRHNLEIYQPERIRKPENVELLRSLSLDAAHRTLFVADTGNQAVRQVDLKVHIVNTLVNLQDARAIAGVQEFTPGGVAFDGDDLVAIADIKNHILWAYDLSLHRLCLLSGAPGQQGLVDGDADRARFWLPTTITLADDRSGFIVTEAGNRQRRHVTREGHVRTLR